jgi:hypothetical protein
MGLRILSGAYAPTQLFLGAPTLPETMPLPDPLCRIACRSCTSRGIGVDRASFLDCLLEVGAMIGVGIWYGPLAHSPIQIFKFLWPIHA